MTALGARATLPAVIKSIRAPARSLPLTPSPFPLPLSPFPCLSLNNKHFQAINHNGEYRSQQNVGRVVIATQHSAEGNADRDKHERPANTRHKMQQDK